MMKTVQLKIGNMFCTHCQETIENALKRNNGIVCAEVSSRKGKGTFFKSSLFYNLVRLVSYTIFGFILGLAGFIFGGILVVVMGFTMIFQGTILGGFTFPKISFQRIQIDAEAVTEGNVQTVSTELQRGTYPNIKVKSGIPVKWIINAPTGSIYSSSTIRTFFTVAYSCKINGK